MYSLEIERFIKMMKQAQSDYTYHYEEVGKKDKETTDLLHQFELGKYYKDRIKAAPKLRKVRQERRNSKDVVENTEEIVEFFSKNRAILNELSQLLGKVRKAEKKHENRSYTPRVRNDLNI